MSTLANFYKVGQEIEVQISKPKIGNFPIGKVVGHNVTCLFERTKKFFEIGSIWKVEITEVKNRNLTIKPIEQVSTKTEVATDFDKKLAEFKRAGFSNGNAIFK